ncbi:MAG: RNA polymerase sigma factor [Phycisphaerae bacterium]
MSVEVTTHISLLDRLSDESDPAAWREFHDRYAELLRGFARRRYLQPADCDDIVQDVLLALGKALPNFAYDPNKGKFRAYLKTIAIRAIYKKSSQNRGEAMLGNLEEATRTACEDEEVDQAWESEWREYHVRQAMRVLSAEIRDLDRQAFQMYGIDGRPIAEVSAALGMSHDAIYQAKSRILKRLSAIIQRQVADEG